MKPTHRNQPSCAGHDNALTRDVIDLDAIETSSCASKARGPQSNISFFAFTATPRNVTLERFGRVGADGKPYPFHLYSMRQAIEEGFILDVLQNYTTYEAYYQLEKAIEDDPAFEGRRAQRRVARFASLHPTAIDQKVEVIVEHFRRHVAMEIEGQAKAMVVTQSREHALKYWQNINQYIQDKGIKAFVLWWHFQVISNLMVLERCGLKLEPTVSPKPSCASNLIQTNISYLWLRRSTRRALTSPSWRRCMLIGACLAFRRYRHWRV